MAKSKKKIKKDEIVNSYNNNFQPNDSYFSAPIDAVKNSSAENYINVTKKGEKDKEVYTAPLNTAKTSGETASYADVNRQGDKNKTVNTPPISKGRKLPKTYSKTSDKIDKTIYGISANEGKEDKSPTYNVGGSATYVAPIIVGNDGKEGEVEAKTGGNQASVKETMQPKQANETVADEIGAHENDKASDDLQQPSNKKGPDAFYENIATKDGINLDGITDYNKNGEVQYFNTLISDILIGDDEKEKQSQVEANIGGNQTGGADTNASDDFALNSEVRKYEQELLETKKQLQAYLSKFSDEYLDKIRKSDYYKERLAYWKDYYAKRRQEAEQKDQEDNLARSEALKEMGENKQPSATETAKQGEVKGQEQKANKGEEMSDADKNNTEKICKTDLSIVRIDAVLNNIYNEQYLNDNQTIDGDTNENGNQPEQNVKVEDTKHNELVNNVNKYVTSILLESMHDSLQNERDSLRKVTTKLSNNEKSSYLAGKFDQKYNIYNDAFASFDSVMTKNGNENKKEAGKRQKDAQTFSTNPQLKTANDMIIDGLRTTYVNNISQYMTNIIVEQIENQNLQDNVMVTKSSMKDIVGQIMANSKPEFEKIVDKTDKAKQSCITNEQNKIEEIKKSLSNKNLSKDQKAKLKAELNEKQNSLQYYKFENKYSNSKYEKLLKKPSANFVMGMALENELEDLRNLQSKGKINEYSFDENEAKKLSNAIIKMLGRNDKQQLNFKAKDNVKQKEPEEVLNNVPSITTEDKPKEAPAEKVEPKQEQPDKESEVKEETSKKILNPMEERKAREQFIEERSDALMCIINFADIGVEFAEKNNDKKLERFFNRDLNCARTESTFWTCQVMSMKERIEFMIDNNQKVPLQYFEMYYEDYNNPALDVYKYDGANVLNKMKEVGAIDDEKKYADVLKMFDNISSNVYYVENIKNKEIKETIQFLSRLVPEYDCYIFCSNLSKHWKNAINGQLEQKPCEDLPTVLPRDIVNENDLKDAYKMLENNEKYYERMLNEKANPIRNNLEILEKYKDKLRVYEKAVLKDKQEQYEKMQKREFSIK